MKGVAHDTLAAKSDSKPPANSVNEDISQQVDPGSATITVSAVEVPELTEQEISESPVLGEEGGAGVF
ncbi:hypothetical protein [Nostoc sphaeroides]|uniref:hypothetical protein n=1 Tax=Nostoc sphaeroides TaxID=446679 RepID=UPI003977D3DF